MRTAVTGEPASNRAETEGEALKLVDDAVLELVFNCPLTFDMSRRRLLLLGVALVAEALAPTTPRTVHLVVNPNSGSRAGLDILDAAVPVKDAKKAVRKAALDDLARDAVLL